MQSILRITRPAARFLKALDKLFQKHSRPHRDLTSSTIATTAKVSDIRACELNGDFLALTRPRAVDFANLGLRDAAPEGHEGARSDKPLGVARIDDPEA